MRKKSEMNLEALVCHCCGGQINRIKMQCDYCGTQFKEENKSIIRIETFNNPVKTITSKAVIPIENMQSGEKYNEYVIRDLARQMTNDIYDCMKIHSEYNPRLMQNEVYAMVKVIIPKEVSE